MNDCKRKENTVNRLWKALVYGLRYTHFKKPNFDGTLPKKKKKIIENTCQRQISSIKLGS